MSFVFEYWQCTLRTMQKYQCKRCLIRLLIVLWNKNMTIRCQLDVWMEFLFNSVEFPFHHGIMRSCMLLTGLCYRGQEHWILFKWNTYLILAAFVYAVTFFWVLSLFFIRKQNEIADLHFQSIHGLIIPQWTTYRWNYLFTFYSTLWWWITLLHLKHQQTISGYCKWAGYTQAWVTEVFFLVSTNSFVFISDNWD